MKMTNNSYDGEVWTDVSTFETKNEETQRCIKCTSEKSTRKLRQRKLYTRYTLEINSSTKVQLSVGDKTLETKNEVEELRTKKIHVTWLTICLRAGVREQLIWWRNGGWNGRQDTQQEDCRQEGGVGEFESDQQLWRRRLGLVGAQTYHRHDVSDETDQTQRTHQDSFDNEVVTAAHVHIHGHSRTICSRTYGCFNTFSLLVWQTVAERRITAESFASYNSPESVFYGRSRVVK